MAINQIDLNLLGNNRTISTYFLPHSRGVAIVDPGPETCLPTMTAALGQHGFTTRDVTHILLTHIHLDHAGAAGWFAAQGAQVCVHPIGTPHLTNPEKLLSSAKRLYGIWMEKLWGEMKPVPAANLVEVLDGAEIVAGDIRVQSIHTPGHAAHHVVYLFEDTIFSGDVGGVRFLNTPYVRLPFVPPETNLEEWRISLKRMRATCCGKIAPAHFGIYPDAATHLIEADHFLDAVNAWLEHNMPSILDVDTLSLRYSEFLNSHGVDFGLDEAALAVYDGGNPISFAASGLFRYWHKVRNRM